MRSPMAREGRSPMARGNSQVVPSARVASVAARAFGRNVGGRWLEGEALCPRSRALDRKGVAGKGLAANDVADVVGEVLERREAAGLRVQMREVETPAVLLPAAVLAHDAVEPALQPASQREIRAIDSQDERVLEDAGVEPIGQDELDAERPAVGVGSLLPFIDPGKAMPATLRRPADGGGDGCRLEPVEAGLEAQIVPGARAPADEGQDLVRGRRH